VPAAHVVACVDAHAVAIVVAVVEAVAAFENVPAVHGVQVLSAAVVAAAL